MANDLDFICLPVAEMEFMQHGFCVGLDPDLFFPESGKRVPLEARQACDQCDVRPRCLEWALKYEDFGYWGGTTPDERTKLRRHKRVAA